MARGIRAILADEMGVAFVLVAISLVAVVSAAAIAVDIGLMATARTEAQRSADASALAGAGALAIVPGDEGVARAAAIDFAGRNLIRGQPASVLPEDITVDLAQSRVTVVVNRTWERGNPVATFFARVFGVTGVSIRAMATAEASEVGSSYEETCYLPVMLPDRWFEAPGVPAQFGDTWDPVDDGDTYVAPGPSVSSPSGYTDADFGKLVFLRSAEGGGTKKNPENFNPSWYFPWTPFGDEAHLDDKAGGAAYRDRFTSCTAGTYGPGSTVYTEPGGMIGPTKQGFSELEALDPNASWCTTCGTDNRGCVVRPTASGGYPGTGDNSCVTNSPRIKPIPLFDPTQSLANGRKELFITNTGYVFVTGQQGKDFVGRWMGGLVDPGSGGSGGPGPTSGPLPKVLRLIE